MDEDGFAKVLSRKEKKAIKDRELRARIKEEAEQSRAAKSAKKQRDEEAKLKASTFPFLDFSGEIRNKIYRYALSRPAGKYVKIREFKHKWECPSVFFSLSPRAEQSWMAELSWTTKATMEELAKVKRGEWVQPKEEYPAELLAGVAVCWANRRANGNYDILHKQFGTMDELGALSLLRVCKQIHAEATPILYGENTFVFNTTGAYSGHHLAIGFSSPDKSLVPFLKYVEGRMTQEQSNLFFQMVFQRENENVTPTFIAESSLFSFAGAIGSQNFSLINNIKIKGRMKTLKLHIGSYLGYCNDGNIGFARTLPYCTHFLNYVCRDLRKLTLHVEYKDDWDSNTNTHWDNDIHNRLGLSDKQRVDNMIGKVVAALPKLKELRLGEYKIGTKQLDTDKQNYVAPYNKAEAEEARKQMDEVIASLPANSPLAAMFLATPPAVGDREQGPDEWVAALHHVDEVKERERARVRKLRELPVGACLEEI
ncbi:uncharacterized protein PAC_05305 [Phialocephala subalpina]|uniref:Uncharacterized protein n=1 Tax=Phialocephala subalpina TaxID=576137 RepID=A0A1L7WRM1_9HELO|nr:uncharacterized protein PAC_05305 [Phialocephala subalpina]